MLMKQSWIAMHLRFWTASSGFTVEVYRRSKFIIIRLMNSKVLIAGLNGANTELAKNLVLTAINLDIADSKEISQDILDKNFLFGPNHLGQKVH
jgi:molybdopterin/thiamine biosynthesis adenylyltransferase